MSNNNRDIVDEIKGKLDIVDVVRQTVNIQTDMDGIYKGAMSSHSKSGKSLHVNSRMQCYHDWAGGTGGDVFNWIANEKGLDCKRDFAEVLQIAADMAGVKLREETPEQKEYNKQKVEVQDLLTKAAELYHENLTDEVRAYITKRWGITNETIDELKIGYAKAGDGNVNLRKAADSELWGKTGLFYVYEQQKNENTHVAREVFQGRVMFPYWVGGKVVSFAGRGDFNKPINTPRDSFTQNEDGTAKNKYLKLLVHSESHPYVAKCVNNTHIWGEDTVRKKKMCIITEGIADAVVLMQRRYPVLSPVTTKFPKASIHNLIKATRGKDVYICNDNEASGAGEDGAIRTGLELKKAGVNVKMVTLPLAEGETKIDVAEYFLTHSNDDFNDIVYKSVSLYTHLLSKIDVGKTKADKINAAKKFINEIVKYESPEEAEETIRYEIKDNENFKLNDTDVKTLLRHYKSVSEYKESKEEEQEKEEVDPRDIDFDEGKISQEMQEAARKEAETIMKTGKPLKKILETVGKTHKGDVRFEELLTVSIASQSCVNTAGIMPALHGSSGSGKSHAVKSGLHLVRAKYKLESTMSAKAAYYNNLKPGCIVFSDDSEPDEAMEQTVKRSTTNFQEKTIHTTVHDGVGESHVIPERIMYLFTSVDNNGSDQMSDRQVKCNTENTEAHRLAAVKAQLEESKRGAYGLKDVDFDVLVCRYIYDNIKCHNDVTEPAFRVCIPYADKINFGVLDNLRNTQRFQDMIKSYAILNHMQRETKDGCLMANVEDFESAKNLFESQMESAITKLTEKENKIVKYIANHGACTITDISDGTGFSYGVVRNILKGRKGQVGGGLLEKIEGLTVSQETHTEADDNTRVSKTCEYFSMQNALDNFGGFETFAVLAE